MKNICNVFCYWCNYNFYNRITNSIIYRHISIGYFIPTNYDVNLQYNRKKIMALEFSDSNFEQEVLKSETPVLVDFWAEWCGPCRMIGPIVEEIATEYNGKAKIGKMNIDMNQSTPMKYGVRSIPTLLVFKNGEVVDKIVGAVPKASITDKIDNQLA